jgi:hypothetical protein
MAGSDDERHSDKPPPSGRALVWMERAVWLLILLGLLAITLGIFLVRGEGSDGVVLGYFLIGKGAIAVVAGVVLIWFRSRWP